MGRCSCPGTRARPQGDPASEGLPSLSLMAVTSVRSPARPRDSPRPPGAGLKAGVLAGGNTWGDPDPPCCSLRGTSRPAPAHLSRSMSRARYGSLGSLSSSSLGKAFWGDRGSRHPVNQQLRASPKQQTAQSQVHAHEATHSSRAVSMQEGQQSHEPGPLVS